MRTSTLLVALIFAALSGALAVIFYDKVTEPPAEPVTADTSEETTTEPARDIPARERGFKDDFAALNAQREGVQIMPSGVQYEVIESGGGERPSATDAVLVRYEASTADGRVFDTTEDDQQALVLDIEDIAVPGLREALLQMREGDHWRVVIPPSQGFGRTGNNQLRRRDVIYDIRLLQIEPPSRSEEG